MLLLFKIGFLPITIWDVLDILIVGYLMYQLYKLLRGSIAFNIFIGVLTLYTVWWLVEELDMKLLAAVLGEFVKLGVLIIIIIFQPEVRRFLLFLGNSTLRQRSHFLDRILNRNFETSEQRERQIRALKAAMVRMGRQKTGALIVLSKNVNLDGLTSSGVTIEAIVSESLLESIFNKDSPLHDGAVIISNGKIHAASVVLPVSESPNLPKSAGLRHRAAVGITERSNVAAFVVSEESGSVSFAFDGRLERRIAEKEITRLLEEHYV